MRLLALALLPVLIASCGKKSDEPKAQDQRRSQDPGGEPTGSGSASGDDASPEATGDGSGSGTGATERQAETGSDASAITTEDAGTAAAAARAKAATGSTLALRNFTVTDYDAADGNSTATARPLIKVIAPGTTLDALLATQIDPMGLDATVSRADATALCGDLTYAGVEGGWRLPKQEELDALRGLGFAYLGTTGAPLNVRGELWYEREARAEVSTSFQENVTVDSYSYYWYSSVNYVVSTFTMSHPTATAGGVHEAASKRLGYFACSTNSSNCTEATKALDRTRTDELAEAVKTESETELVTRLAQYGLSPRAGFLCVHAPL